MGGFDYGSLSRSSNSTASVNELADILEARANLGLPAGVVEREQLEAIADEVAGIARDGIQSLRRRFGPRNSSTTGSPKRT